MTTKEQWKAGILFGGMLVIAGVVNSRWPVRDVGQPQAHAPVSSFTPVQPQAAPPTVYPIVKWVNINRKTWSEPVVTSITERMDWVVYDNVQLLISDDGKVYVQDSGSHFETPGAKDHRSTAFMIGPGGDSTVSEAKVKCTITDRATAPPPTQQQPNQYSIVEKTLPSATTIPTAPEIRTSPQWPSDFTPTRTAWLPPDNFRQGAVQVIDRILPSEDVYYRIKNGWTVSPVAQSGPESIQWSLVPVEGAKNIGLTQNTYECTGVRIRSTNPNDTVVMRFKIAQNGGQNQNLNFQKLGPPSYPNQPVPNNYPTPPPPAVPPQQPSYYPTSPTGPSYYPTSPAQPARKK